uniref:Reverse transcriptase domain-containing protein n=1 Tax=Haemonchus contortus TaxID=6289 RepID=A0A7I4YN09_HAECO
MSLKESRCNATESAGADAHLQGPETRWSCCKSSDISHGFKAVLCGGPKTTNGVGIIVSERLRDSIVGVERFDDRLMKVIVVIECQKYHFFSAYAPQAGCSEQIKDKFWNLLDEKTAEVWVQEAIVVAGDLNGAHVGATKDDYRCHGGFGYGSRNNDGERILEYADSHNLVIVNTKFRKRDSHLITFYSGENKTQIDFVLVRHRDQGLVTDAKTVPYETVATQHRPLICTLKIAPPKPKFAEKRGPARIKWWRLKEKEKESAVVSRILLPAATTVEETWKSAVEAITRVARSELGMTKPGRRKIYKQTWLWTDHVRDKVREKKKQYHAFLLKRQPIIGSAIRSRRKRRRRSLLLRRHSLCRMEREARVSRRSGLWKSKCWNPAGWLTDFFNQVVAEKKVPESWQQTIPIWKKKGSPGDCARYRPIRLLSHSMKIFERIVDSRIRDIVELTTNQSGFVSGCSTIDATHATRLLLEKHREKRRPVHLAFLDLEKAFDRDPRDVVWYALRQHGVPEELIEWVRILYTSPKSRVQTTAGTSTDYHLRRSTPGLCVIPTTVCCRHGCHYKRPKNHGRFFMPMT